MDKESLYWRSLREHSDADALGEAKAHEFMAGVTDGPEQEGVSPISRKQFLALMAASAAFAASGCSGYRDKGEIVPYTRKPEEVTPGVAAMYASTCVGCAQACGVLVKTREGRPVKIDGNPDHPVNAGAICARGQAGILGLYDPARLREPAHGSASGKSGNTSWAGASAAIVSHLEECVRAGREIAIVAPAITSPTTASVFGTFAAAYPGTRIYSLAVSNDENRRRAWERCYGAAGVPRIRWDEAEMVLALEGDFLGTDGTPMEQIRLFSRTKDIVHGARPSRLYCVEGNLSLTGTNADYRLRLRPDAQESFVLALMKEVVASGIVQDGGRASAALAGVASLSDLSTRYGMDREVAGKIVRDLVRFRGKTVIFAGSLLPENVHVAVNHLNELLGNTRLYESNSTSVTHVPLSTEEEIRTLVERMNGGGVGLVIHCGSNPAYQLPPSTGYERALRSVPMSVSLTEMDDETSRLCTYMLPAHTALESWGDHEVRKGVLSLQQPVVFPLHDSRQREAVLLHWTNPDAKFSETLYHEFLRHRWTTEVYTAAAGSADPGAFWYTALHDGVVTLEAGAVKSPALAAGTLAPRSDPPDAESYVVSLAPAYFVGDGTFANNGWLQELPHPVSKVVWDNYAAISPRTAKALGVEDGDVLSITLPHGAQTFPAFVQAGNADRHIAVTLGYGRWNGGPIGTGVGSHAGALLAADSFLTGRVFTGARIARQEGSHPLVSTQEHHALDDMFVKDLHVKRKIIREGTVGQYGENPKFLRADAPELFNIAAEVEYKDVKWGMAIDLNRCIGCNACVAGCNVENNIPVIGKEQVDRGREMQWIRIDRYYAGTPDEPLPSHQPMLCQHCDMAPCENVCPVVATNHSPDGLNQMVYNRCVGTKYCANNCPYKVRRFNFLNFRSNLADGYYADETVALVQNPEVTVRSRGVMEKCTFCVQRIAEARQHAAEQGRPVAGGDVRTACQDACPASAIVFGDVNDPKSEVAKYRSHDLGYHVLEELNVRPNVTYLARLRNIDPEKPA